MLNRPVYISIFEVVYFPLILYRSSEASANFARMLRSGAMRRKNDRLAAIFAKMFFLSQMLWVYHVFAMSSAWKIKSSMYAQQLAKDAHVTFKRSVWMQKLGCFLISTVTFALRQNLECAAYYQTNWVLLLMAVVVLSCSLMPSGCDGGFIAGILACGVEFECYVSREWLKSSNYCCRFYYQNHFYNSYRFLF